MARTAGSKIKDVKLDRWFGVHFTFNDKTYMFCKPLEKYTFLPLEDVACCDIEWMNIQKFESKLEAKEAIKKIPEIEMAGVPMKLEPIMNNLLLDRL